MLRILRLFGLRGREKQDLLFHHVAPSIACRLRFRLRRGRGDLRCDPIAHVLPAPEGRGVVPSAIASFVSAVVGPVRAHRANQFLFDPLPIVDVFVVQVDDLSDQWRGDAERLGDGVIVLRIKVRNGKPALLTKNSERAELAFLGDQRLGGQSFSGIASNATSNSRSIACPRFPFVAERMAPRQRPNASGSSSP